MGADDTKNSKSLDDSNASQLGSGSELDDSIGSLYLSDSETSVSDLDSILGSDIEPEVGPPSEQQILDYVEELAKDLSKRYIFSMITLDDRYDPVLTRAANKRIEKNSHKLKLKYFQPYTEENNSPYIRPNISKIKGSRVVIPGTNLTTNLAPKTLNELNRFFSQTVFTAKAPVDEIAAIISSVQNRSAILDRADCLDYFSEDYETEDYRVNVKKLTGRLNAKGTAKEFSSEVKAQLIITAKETGETRALTVNVFPTADNGTIDFVSDDSVIKTMDGLYEFYLTSLQKPVIVHCKNCAGRAGHTILTLLLFQYREQIFVDDIDATRANIDALTNYIKIFFRGFVDLEEQWEAAVANALRLDEYVEAKSQQGQLISEPQLVCHSDLQAPYELTNLFEAEVGNGNTEKRDTVLKKAKKYFAKLCSSEIENTQQKTQVSLNEVHKAPTLFPPTSKYVSHEQIPSIVKLDNGQQPTNEAGGLFSRPLATHLVL